MNNHMRVLPAAIERLNELAYNLWFSWNEEASELFRRMDPALWERSAHNPALLLSEIEDGRLDQLGHDENFAQSCRLVMQRLDCYMDGEAWFQFTYPNFRSLKFAYFSAEFGFHESLPIYSGGLGILAGDHCKSASDLGIPLIGIGLLYKKGYFRQQIDSFGRQQALPLQIDFAKLPILPVRIDNQDLKVSVELSYRNIMLKVWRAQIGRNPVYLLDADLQENHESDRLLTAQLYGGNLETRIAQEMILGIGGIRALRALSIYPQVYHINEGHAAFLTLERIKEYVQKGLSFDAALETVRSATVFTTHTPVPAGHDAFAYGLVEHYLGAWITKLPSLRHRLLELGLDRRTGLFNMTHLALNTASHRNGVSKLHGVVSREMFRGFHGSLDPSDVPINAITNGVHMDTWLAPEWKDLLSRFLPGTWKENPVNDEQWKSIELVPDESVWQVHQQRKDAMIRYARSNLQEQRRRGGETQERIDEADTYLSPDALTIGFARRFATYKRATLIFHDLKRLKKLVNDSKRPVQFIFAGKAHPADHPGQEMIREIYKVSQMKEFLGKIVLLENYDMNMARYLVQGVDVWLNNPQRPMEASGTSGQKAAMNGVVNFSVADGWWEEGYNGQNGWVIDNENTESIYNILENEIIPLYYSHESPPLAWIDLMKRSILSLSPVYNTHRMVRDYVEAAYLPSAERARRFEENNYDIAVKVGDFKRFIREKWQHVKILAVDDRSASKQASVSASSHSVKEIKADIFFGPIWPPDTAVEIVYFEEKGSAWNSVVVPMQIAGEAARQTYRYKADIPSHLIHGPHFSVRVRPISANFAHSFELPLITTTLRR